MNTQLFVKEAKMLTARRPAWQFLLEDNIIRILTHQFQVEWSIITELLDADKNLQVVEVTSHGTFGCVITLKCNLGV